ncbi:WSC-domain-containing protein [Corynespora cassiicola Philippines]|uniref:WSC-domain-containing protein n=1 Tax=Corynespora cassiicola Philippines TaxID=1448308 RepID=A0A2T2NE24_CORCC|nr:WSC-domain-containing protein [Corynespora cassiicola Philippines]
MMGRIFKSVLTSTLLLTVVAAGGGFTPHPFNIFSRFQLLPQSPPSSPHPHDLTSRAVAPSPNPPSGWTYIGCYTDSSSGSDSRTLRRYFEDSINLYNGADTNLFDTNSASACIDFCRTRGFNYAGMEYFFQCFCSNHIQSPGARVPDSECTAPCRGNDAEACGGDNRLTIYWNGLPFRYAQPPASLPAGWEYAGCWTNGENSLATLRNGYFLRSSPHNMNAEICIGVCAQRGYKVAGTHEMECFCSNEISSPGRLAILPCVQPCPERREEACGGTMKLSIYRVKAQVCGFSDSRVLCVLCSGDVSCSLFSLWISPVFLSYL